ncbi:17612_t:CDS:2 [Acaulospora colombiana]|uniref:17612_t:CDS:1 n=1 Tax=Acaulospora colombiana TaxID=27376 RepID=A0ACA9LYH0_9GLOM|nr:17612_t:CDS:2 [Acaulospora colombiana]
MEPKNGGPNSNSSETCYDPLNPLFFTPVGQFLGFKACSAAARTFWVSHPMQLSDCPRFGHLASTPNPHPAGDSEGNGSMENKGNLPPTICSLGIGSVWREAGVSKSRSRCSRWVGITIFIATLIMPILPFLPRQWTRKELPPRIPFQVMFELLLAVNGKNHIEDWTNGPSPNRDRVYLKEKFYRCNTHQEVEFRDTEIRLTSGQLCEQGVSVSDQLLRRAETVALMFHHNQGRKPIRNVCQSVQLGLVHVPRHVRPVPLKQFTSEALVQHLRQQPGTPGEQAVFVLSTDAQDAWNMTYQNLPTAERQRTPETEEVTLGGRNTPFLGMQPTSEAAATAEYSLGLKRRIPMYRRTIPVVRISGPVWFGIRCTHGQSTVPRLAFLIGAHIIPARNSI